MNSFLKKLTFLIYLGCSLCYSQDVKNKFDEKKGNLLNSGVELLIEYKISKGDNLILLEESDCIDFEEKYLFWINENNCFVQRYSDCILNEQTKLKDCKRLIEVFNNLNFIKKAEVLPVTFKNGDYIEFVHESAWQFDIYSIENHFTKSIGINTWKMEYYEDGEKNVNYEINRNSKMELLIDLRKEIID
jgi:hypothetical protein